MMCRSVIVLGVAVLLAGCQDKQSSAPAAASPTQEASKSVEAVATPLKGNPSVDNCTQQLVAWVSEGLTISVGESKLTASGCEFTAEAAGVDYEGVKAAVVRNLNQQGYALAGSTDVSNGQRLTFRNGDHDISVLCRSSEHARTKLEGGTARLDFHWYDRAVARAHKKASQ